MISLLGVYILEKQFYRNKLFFIIWIVFMNTDFLQLINIKLWLHLNILNLSSISIDWLFNNFFDFRWNSFSTSFQLLWWRCHHEVVGASCNINAGASNTINNNHKKHSNYQTKPYSQWLKNDAGTNTHFHVFVDWNWK